MNEAELERAIAKLKARLLMEKGEENSFANGEIRRRLVRLQTLRIKLKEMEEVNEEYAKNYSSLYNNYGKVCLLISKYINFDKFSYIRNQALSIILWGLRLDIVL
jgi:hypothetical protein